jgi:hypothetical protein
MALADGLAGLEDAGRSFKQLATVAKSYTIVQKAITAGQWLWNAAMAANPIGAIVAVVVALIAAGYALVKMFIASSEATKNAEKANKALNKELETEVKNQKLANQEADLARDAQLKLAKASGQSAAEIRKLSLELANQEVAQKMANAQSLRAIAIEAIRKASVENASDELKETAKNALKEFNDANEALKTAVLNRRKLIIDNRVAEVQEATDAREKEKEKQKKHNEELLEKQKKANQERIDEFLKLKRAETEAANQAALDREKADTAFFDREMEAQKNNRLAKMSARNAEIENVRLKFAEDLEYARKNGLDAAGLEEEKRRLIKEINDKYDLEANEKRINDNNIRLEAERKFNQNLIDAEMALQSAKRNALNEGLEMLQQFAGKNKALALGILAVQKGLAIADIVVNASKSIAATTSSTAAANAIATAASPLTFGQPWVAANTLMGAKNIATTKISAGINIAAILASTIQSAKSITSSGGGVSGGTGGGGGAPAPPQFNLVGQSSTNQLTQTIAGQQQQPIQAFVVGSEVTSQQSLDRNAQQTSVFG